MAIKAMFTLQSVFCSFKLVSTTATIQSIQNEKWSIFENNLPSLCVYSFYANLHVSIVTD